MTKIFLCLILLCLGTTVASEVAEYIIRPSQSQSCDDRCSKAESVDNLALSQFISNSIYYLKNETSLIFSPGNHSLESELIVENVHSFSMFTWSSFSLKAVIVCDHNVGFEFRNASVVIVSGLEFVGCSQNHVVSVDQLQLENSSFSGSGREIVSGPIVTIDESTANLDRVVFVSAKFKRISNHPVIVYATDADLVISHSTFTNNNGVYVLGAIHTNVSIRHSEFIGNNGKHFME